MSTFDPSKIILQDIYTDPFQLLKETNVYGNGRMQAMVFPTATYEGIDASSQVIEQVKKYIAQHTTIYVLTDEGGIKPLDAKWEKSTESNGFLHDIYRSIRLGFLKKPLLLILYTILEFLFFSLYQATVQVLFAGLLSLMVVK